MSSLVRSGQRLLPPSRRGLQKALSPFLPAPRFNAGTRTWGRSLPPRRFFSQHEETAEDSSTSGSSDDQSVKRQQQGFNGGPLVQFPWRHEQHLMPRLELEAIKERGDFRAKMFLKLWEKSTGVMMEIPWLHLIGNAWRQDIADPAAWAFSRGVAGLLSNIYRGKFSTPI